MEGGQRAETGPGLRAKAPDIKQKGLPEAAGCGAFDDVSPVSVRVLA